MVQLMSIDLTFFNSSTFLLETKQSLGNNINENGKCISEPFNPFSDVVVKT